MTLDIPNSSRSPVIVDPDSGHNRGSVNWGWSCLLFVRSLGGMLEIDDLNINFKGQFWATHN